MQQSTRFFFVFCFIFGFCMSLSAQKKKVYVDYINKYSDLAVKHRDKNKIPASIKLAQALLETGAGTSELARSSNNHFGIKCHSDWTGEKVYRKDDNPNDCFRKYKKVEDSYEDHSNFLLKYSRYSVLFNYKITDYKSWAKGLQTCGYATSQGYANSLIKLVEDYELYKFDSKLPIKSLKEKEKEKKEKEKEKEKTKGKPVLTRNTYKTFNLIYIIAEEDDSFEKIADETGFKVKNLIKYNEVNEDFPLKKGDIVYLQKKKSKADLPNFEHLVKIGESMHSISQKYGIQVKKLYKMNKKKSDYVPTEGDVLRLR